MWPSIFLPPNGCSFLFSEGPRLQTALREDADPSLNTVTSLILSALHGVSLAALIWVEFPLRFSKAMNVQEVEHIHLPTNRAEALQPRTALMD